MNEHCKRCPDRRDRPAAPGCRAARRALLSTARRIPDIEWFDVATGGAHDNWFDHLTGSDWIRTAIDAGRTLGGIEHGWRGDLQTWARLRRRYLRY